VVGTFLPWLRSGRASRNSYEATGAVRRLIHPPGLIGELFKVWPLIGALCAVAVASYLLGLRWVGVLVATVASIAGGAAAIAALTARTNAYASVIDTGPAVTLAGAAVVFISAVGHLVAREQSTANARISGRTPQ
jgi:hypothetical protein